MTHADAKSGEVAWQRYVEGAGRDVRALDVGLSTGSTERETLAQLAFRLGLSSLLVGAEDVARLSLAIERKLEDVALGEQARRDALRTPLATLLAAIIQLENADKSGARVEGLPLAELTRALEEALPSDAPGTPAPRPVPPAPLSPVQLPTAAPTRTDPQATAAFVWAPAVDDDMIELFFDEASERIEAISGKLLELERRATDIDLLRDLFRDLHTVKGSSAMVGLEPVNRLAHAAEDLVGQLREGTRVVDGHVVSALLATLDGLRKMLDAARARQPITLDPTAIVRALRDPTASSAAPSPPATAALPTTPGRAVEASQPQALATPGGAAHSTARQTIRVDFDKLDRLLNLVGELVLGRDGLRNANAALASVAAELSADRAFARRIARAPARGSVARAPHATTLDLVEELGRVERVLGSVAGDLDVSTVNLDSISSELREQVMRLRMISIGGIFRKHQRTVRDLGISLGKRAHLDLQGEETELDKVLVEALDEPLLHLLRNAVDHGIEPPDEREALGKPAEASVLLSAFHRGNQIVIRIADDGRGMDAERLKQKAVEKGVLTEAEAAALDERGAYDLIFRPGFSTKSSVSDVSGRGVGMDVVRQTIVTRLKGTIDVESKLGQGSAFVLRLPLTLAIIQVLLANVSGETFAIPLDGVARTIAVSPADVQLVGDREVFELDGRTHPLIRLVHVLELEGQAADPDESFMVVLTEQSGELYGIACDRLLGRKEIVIKSLGGLLAEVPCVSGATILGDRCALILDIPAVVQRAIRKPGGPVSLRSTSHVGRSAAVLLVEDSDTVRESLRRLLVEAGFDVTTAEDGRVALELCQARRFDVVSTDVMMPHMDGYELTRALRAMPSYRDTPIVMVTSRGERIDRVRGFDAGVDDYITKPHDRQLLLRSIRKLLGHDKVPA